MNDIFNLNRFVRMQNPRYKDILDELAKGVKKTHWIWFIFPQIKDLGTSYISQVYAITTTTEATHYLNHPILGKRLIECTQLIIKIKKGSLLKVFGKLNYLKIQSSMTLFDSVSTDPNIFKELLIKHFDGELDHKTIEIIKSLEKNKIKKNHPDDI